MLDYVLVGRPDVPVFSERPWPSFEVDGLVVDGVCRSGGGLVVNRNVCWERGEGSEKGSCYFCSSRGDRFTVEAAVELKSSVGGLVVLSNIAFVKGDRCVGCSFDVPCAESA